MTGFTVRRPVSAILAGAAFFAGCAIHPIPDDVSRYSTVEIVRNVRCEAKEAVRERIQLALLSRGLGDIDPERVLADPRNFERIKRTDAELAAKFFAYGASTISYRFEFKITEKDDNSGSVTFALPFTRGDFSLELGGKLNKERFGDRIFTTSESFEELVYLNCEKWRQPAPNIAYPLTGSIGIRNVINTFINVAELRGGDKMFTDDITFTTYARGKVNSTLELIPVKDVFDVAKADATLERSRLDIHMVKVSLAFPDLREVEAIRGLKVGMLSRFSIETKERALINMCIAEGEAREDQFRVLRDISPREYCHRNGLLAPW